MPALSLPITADGLCVDVVVGFDGRTTTALRKSGQAVPRPIRARGLIDSGTDVTAVPAAFRQRLQVPLQYQASTQTFTGLTSARLFKISLSITDFARPSSPWFVEPDLLVMELPVSLGTVDVLIGPDILLQCKLLLDGPARQFTLEF